MFFNFKEFIKFTTLALFKSRGTHYRLTPKRIGCIVGFYLFFPVLELVIRIGFLLDDIFFRGYRRQRVRKPVFIVGNPRSGTTFLQRLMAKDTENFTCMRTWEILLAPSVTQRRVVQALRALDRRLGGPLKRLQAAVDKRWQDGNVMHKVALRAPEEDQYLLVHIWSTLAVWVYAAILEGATRYVFFDTQMSPAEKKRIMTFYKGCVQRHLHAQADGDRRRARHYLSKNPSCSPKVDTIYRFFPDARIIYLVRNPLDVIPSYISLLDYTWRFLADPLEEYGSRDYVLEMARHWYRYPLEQLERAPRENYVVVNYNDLVQDAERTVADIYRRLGFEISPDFARVLREEAEKARNYRSEHEYSLEQMGLTREQIVAEYEDVFARFGFDTGEDGGEGVGLPRAEAEKRRRRRRAPRRPQSKPRRSLGFAENT